MPVELTVQNVYGLLIRSKLLPLDECRDMYTRWQQEAKENSTNLGLFAKWIVTNKFLTEYQAALLARGHAEGFHLNNYIILDRLGKGRMAGVYRAKHETGPIVAIKVLPPSRGKDPSLLARFQREARVAIKLKHPNIVRSFQVGEASQPGSNDRIYYLVMEHLEGETLEDVLQRRRQFPPGEAVRIVYQALLGLQHLHEKGLVHRDLKPSNLMLAYPPGAQQQNDTLKATVKILDMGLVRTLSDEVIPDPERGDQQLHLTSEGIVLGTPDYMAPEQARDARSADIRADIYALGCVLYHLLDGRPPFPDTNIISQMIRHATEPIRPLKDVNPAVPDGLQQIIGWMMAKDPAQRYPTPERAAQALQMFLSVGAEAITPEADPKMKKYLTTLETDGDDDRRARAAQTMSPGAASTSSPAPAKPPSGTVPAAKPVEKAEGEKPRLKGAALRRKKARLAAAAGKKPAPDPLAAKKREAAPAIDVELVALPPTGDASAVSSGAKQKLIGLPLTRRDMAMFGIGVGTVVVGGLIGLALVKIIDFFDAPSTKPVDDDDE